mmetsp:Transcript_60764/g.96550  ORF Transcript_60764/g.96550 Transcript_60764/m.96550 type:complete len:248 (+) Transcript_60764:1005-1748(+)
MHEIDILVMMTVFLLCNRHELEYILCIFHLERTDDELEFEALLVEERHSKQKVLANKPIEGVCGAVRQSVTDQRINIFLLFLQFLKRSRRIDEIQRFVDPSYQRMRRIFQIAVTRMHALHLFVLCTRRTARCCCCRRHAVGIRNGSAYICRDVICADSSDAVFSLILHAIVLCDLCVLRDVGVDRLELVVDELFVARDLQQSLPRYLRVGVHDTFIRHKLVQNAIVFHDGRKVIVAEKDRQFVFHVH